MSNAAVNKQIGDKATRQVLTTSSPPCAPSPCPLHLAAGQGTQGSVPTVQAVPTKRKQALGSREQRSTRGWGAGYAGRKTGKPAGLCAGVGRCLCSQPGDSCLGGIPEGCGAVERLGPGTGHGVFLSLSVLLGHPQPVSIEAGVGSPQQGREAVGGTRARDTPVLPSHPGLGMAHSKASAGLPVPLPSGVPLDEASAAAKQRWQAEAVRAGGPPAEGRTGRGQEEQGQRAGTCVVTRVLCQEPQGHLPAGSLCDVRQGCHRPEAGSVICVPLRDWLEKQKDTCPLGWPLPSCVGRGLDRCPCPDLGEGGRAVFMAPPQ